MADLDPRDKKPQWEPPRLEVVGHLTEITQMAGVGKGSQPVDGDGRKPPGQG